MPSQLAWAQGALPEATYLRLWNQTISPTICPKAGSECRVFGGQVRVPGRDMRLTHFYYIFRVGRVVVKLYAAAGGLGDPPALKPDHVKAIADKTVTRITSALP